MQQIADAYNGHPCRQTVSRIVHSYLTMHVVVALQGRKGLKNSTRKFNSEAFEALIVIVMDEEQFLLSGRHVLVGSSGLLIWPPMAVEIAREMELRVGGVGRRLSKSLNI